MDKKENHQNLLWNEKKVMKRNNKHITRIAAACLATEMEIG